MYLFSVNATSRETNGEFAQGEEVPFIVYIDFKDLFGAEKLAQILLIRQGFSDVKIEKRKFISGEQLAANTAYSKDPHMVEAGEKGYYLQAFNAH